MAGVYVHIPFCKSRCRYCDFYSTTMFASRWEAYEEALLNELNLRAETFRSCVQADGDKVETLYFGGGTPSLVNERSIANIIQAIRSAFHKELSLKEVTLEANPGDLTREKLQALKAAGINRLSIGIQSLNDNLLHQIGRRHTAKQAIEVVHMAQEVGFDNISVDLMYGLPGQTMQNWISDVEAICQMNVQHVSAYCLTYEEGTSLFQALERGEVAELEDEILNQMQEYVVNRLSKAGIVRYEISNYAKPGFESRHNSAYWRKKTYLGLGAGAHSYDGKFLRQANPDNLDEYISAVSQAQSVGLARLLHLQDEQLTEDDLYNETVMLGLRTMKGVDSADISSAYLPHFLTQMQRYIDKGLVVKDDTLFAATQEGCHILNRIIEDIMI